MFWLTDLFYLIISAFIILSVVAFMREFSYLVVGAIIGIENPRVTIGSGRKLFLVNLIGFGQVGL